MSSSGGTSMYTMKPVFDTDIAFKFNSGMYQMKNLLSTPEAKNKLVLHPELSAFEEKQERILKHIRDIRNYLDTIRTMIATRNTESKTALIQESTSQLVSVPQEIVINADMDRPPYSVLVIPLIVKDISINVVTHCHSSINSLPPCYHLFNKVAEKTKGSRSSPLKLRLIWRKGETETVFGLLPMSGEVPLMRLVLHIQAAGNVKKEVLLQERLDDFEVYGLQSITAPKYGPFILGGSSPSVLDALVWSHIRSQSTPPEHLVSWYSEFSAFVGV